MSQAAGLEVRLPHATRATRPYPRRTVTKNGAANVVLKMLVQRMLLVMAVRVELTKAPRERSPAGGTAVGTIALLETSLASGHATAAPLVTAGIESAIWSA